MAGLSRDDLRERLVLLRTRVDEHFSAAVERSPKAFACREGCSMCCHARFGVFELEAEPVRAALRELGEADPDLRERVRAQADDPAHADRCALLVDGRCCVYEQRPLICRSQGLPLLADERVDWCPLNFEDEQPPRESVLNLDALNAPLAAMAQAWGGERVDLAEVARGED